MNTSEVLNTAADLIEERGWTTGTSGWASSGPLCTEGAICAAMGIEFDAVDVDFTECPAYLAVMDHLGDAVPCASTDPEKVPVLWAWNDECDLRGKDLRTASEVIEVLRATAVIEAARENAETRTEVSV
jgi:hypothetical protein